MSNPHTIIHSFLKALKELKGDTGKVGLLVKHMQPGQTKTRGVFSSRGFIPAGTEEFPSAVPIEVVKNAYQDITSSQTSTKSVDGSLKVGEEYFFTVTSPINGYLHFFNLGTSGKCERLIPQKEKKDSFFEVNKGQDIYLPSINEQNQFTENGPISAVTGEPERILVIITRNKEYLLTGDLDPRFIKKEGGAGARGPGFSGEVVVKIPKIFDLHNESWEYGLIEINVE